jgi:dihydrofolate synthase/folylpolyglutamate synthase
MSPREWLAHLEQFGIKLGLESVAAIVAELGHPDGRYDVIHVAGTNGKGSVSAMAARALSSAGYRTGLYTSPHLVRVEERVRVDGRSIDPARLDEALLAVRSAAERLRGRGVLAAEPTYFEATTAAAFVAFAAEGVRVAVVEVGLGGRFDATNIVSPIATAITSIDFDHEAQLGFTLEAIAGEKAGIIKPGITVVTGELAPEARVVVERVAAERSAPLVGAAPVTRVGREDDGHDLVQVTFQDETIGPLRLSLAGAHQVGNAAVAVRLLEVVRGRGFDITGADIAAGLTATRWPARLETVNTPRGRALVDGAHNPAGARALASYLSARHRAGLPIVFGAMRDKSLAAMIAPLVPLARPLVCTTAPGARAASAGEIAAVAREIPGSVAIMRDDLDVALADAWAVGPDIVVAGSLYLAGAVLARLGVPVD